VEVDRAFCLDSNTKFAVGFTTFYITPDVGAPSMFVVTIIMVFITVDV